MSEQPPATHSATLHIEMHEGSDQVEMRLSFDQPPDVENPTMVRQLAIVALKAVTDACGGKPSMRTCKKH